MSEASHGVQLSGEQAEDAFLLLAGFEGLLRLGVMSERQLHHVSGFRKLAKDDEPLSQTLAVIAMRLTWSFRDQWGES